MDTALVMFTERGLSGVSVDQVAEAAGYSRGAVYSNFDSKNDLALAIMEERMAMRASQLADEIATNPDWWHPPEETADFTDPWDLLFVELLSEAMRDEEVRSRLADQLRDLTNAIGDGLVRAGFPSDRAQQVAPVAIALINGMQTQFLLTGDSHLFETYREIMPGLIAGDELG